MPFVALVASALVVALAFRHDPPHAGRLRVVLLVGILALTVRLAAVATVFFIARQTHGEGTWLNDEASFFLATEALEHNPFYAALPNGLGHLGGDGYLGLTTWLSVATGVADTNTFRVTNAALGSIVVVLSTLVARRLFGNRVALVGGLVLTFWPSLVLWSATMLRDTLGSVVVVVVWWTLGEVRQLGWWRVLGVLFASLVLLMTLRPYLAVAVACGAVGWAAYPWLRRASGRHWAMAAAGLLLLGVGVAQVQPRRIDYAAHELLYRQTVTRMETLGRLYTDEPPDAANLPIRPGSAVAVVDRASGWLMTGVLQNFTAPDVAQVAFTDETIQELPLDRIVLLQSAPIPPLQLLAWIGPDLWSFLLGTTTSSDPNSPGWISDALLWDALLLVTLCSAVRTRLALREWIYPLCVVGGTVLALVAIPGAPGNADRHRTTQTVPLLVVLACGLAASRLGAVRDDGRTLTSITSRAARAPTPAAS